MPTPAQACADLAAADRHLPAAFADDTSAGAPRPKDRQLGDWRQAGRRELTPIRNYGIMLAAQWGGRTLKPRYDPRVFLALQFSPTAQERLRAAQLELKQYLQNWHFLPDHQFHLTLRFFGEVPEELVSKIGFCAQLKGGGHYRVASEARDPP